MNNIEETKRDFKPRIRTIKLFRFARGQCPWPWETSLVHSVIAFRNRIGFQPTLLELERETRLNRRTISKALAILANHGVQKNGNQYEAHRPEATTEGTIGPYGYIGSKNDHWSDRVAYLKLLLPNAGSAVTVQVKVTDKDKKVTYAPKKKRFTLTHAYLLAVLHSIKPKDSEDKTFSLNNGRLRALTKLTDETIHDGLKVLHFANLIELHNSSYSYSYDLSLFDPDHSPVFNDELLAPGLEAEPVPAKWVQPVVKAIQPAVPKMSRDEFNLELEKLGIAPVGSSPTADTLWMRTQLLNFDRKEFRQFKYHCNERINQYGTDYDGITQAILGETQLLLESRCAD